MTRILPSSVSTNSLDTTPSTEAFTELAVSDSTGPLSHYIPYVNNEFYLEDMLQIITSGLDAIPKPETREDLFDFDFDVQKMFRSHPDTKFLAEPLCADTAVPQRRLSVLCRSMLSSYIPRSIRYQYTTWEADTYGFMAQVRREIPAFFDDRLGRLPLLVDSFQFPSRKKTESMYQYTARVERWIVRRLPEETPKTVLFCAGNMWCAHACSYDVQLASDKFFAAVETFRTYKEVFRWFRNQVMFIERELDANTTKSVVHGGVNKKGRSKSFKKRRARKNSRAN